MTVENRKSRETAGRLALVKGPLIVYVLCIAVFAVTMWDRMGESSHDNHYVYMAEAMLAGRLHIEGNPPHRNDWAHYEDKWYVSFPPAPALLMMPGVAVWGLDFNDRVFTLLLAATAPALLLLLLQMMALRGRISRKPWELGLLATLYALGTVYFFSAVQGSVWYTAHVTGSVMLLLHLIFSLDGRRPILAGLFLGLAFACRPPMLMAFPLFLYEMLRAHADDDAGNIFGWISSAVRNAGFSKTVRRVVLFGIPILAVIGLLMLMNWARFDDPFEFGHGHLKVRQTARIAKWGLFHYHYLPHNLGIILTSLPWISAESPHIKVSLHGLALWFTTPVFLWLLWPAQRTRHYMWAAFTVALIALPSLLYQNSGWVQFGYRFSLDYTPVLILMLALGGRRFGKLLVAGVVFSIVVNLFGAVTFDRMWKYYAGGKDRDRIYQPD